MGRVKNELYGEEEKIKREKVEKERIVNVESEYRRIEKEMIENNRERIKIEKDGMRIIVKRKERIEIDRNKNESNRNEVKQNQSDLQPTTPTLVIAINNFSGEKYDQLDITKNEFLMVTNWNCEDGWVYGYRKDNKEEKGLFPKVLIKIYKEENKGKRTYNDIYFNNITPEYRIQFENKVKKLRSLNEMKLINDHTEILIDRNSVFNDALNIIMYKSPEELKKRLVIKYLGENGIDVGGLLRDFFYQISKEIGNVNYSLFKYPHNNSYELEINPNSNIEPNHLIYFNFIGRIIGLAIFHKHYLSVSFTLLLLKKLLDKPLDIDDLEYVDPEMFRSLKQLKENDGAEKSYLTFEMDMEDCFGNRTTIELKPNGANINVTDSNKNEYIDLIVENKLNNTNDKEQLIALKKGFYDIIPKSINSILDELDLKFLISGINEIDVNDWEYNTEYDGYQADDITIKNFWKCVRNFSNEDRTKLLLFATGNSQVPVTGFKDLQGGENIIHFKLKKSGTENDLPISHTCFNRIDLPPYTSLDVLEQKLLYAITEGIDGFTIG